MREAPKYRVKRYKQKDLPEGRFFLLHIGLYLSDKYGLTPYADIQVLEEEYPVRFNLGKYNIYKVDYDSHNDSLMKDIHDGKYVMDIEKEVQGDKVRLHASYRRGEIDEEVNGKSKEEKIIA